MKDEHREKVESKEICYRELEEFARGKIRDYLQDLLEQEVTEWLGRHKSERKINPSEQLGYRNGHGQTRRFTMSLGTIEIRRR
jgi:putative transposase